MSKTKLQKRSRTVSIVASVLAVGLVAAICSPARACDPKEKKAKRTLVQFRGSGGERGLERRLAGLEARLDRLDAAIDRLADAINGSAPRHDGRSERGSRATPPRHPRGVPQAPDFPFPPEAFADAAEHFREFQHRWENEWQERQGEWQERHQEMMEHWQDRMHEWQERQNEMGDHWREAQEVWERRIEELAEHIQERAHQAVGEIRERRRGGNDERREAKERASRKERGERKERRQTRKRGQRDAQPDRRVYEVEGENADRLFGLLAPSEVTAIVSRAGAIIAVQGTPADHHAINGFLQMVHWIDRDGTYEAMGQGEREQRSYEVGQERAEMLFEFLAPSDVRVIVSRDGDDSVSINGTDREHDALSAFLELLHWTD